MKNMTINFSNQQSTSGTGHWLCSDLSVLIALKWALEMISQTSSGWFPIETWLTIPALPIAPTKGTGLLTKKRLERESPKAHTTKTRTPALRAVRAPFARGSAAPSRWTSGQTLMRKSIGWQHKTHSYLSPLFCTFVSFSRAPI